MYFDPSLLVDNTTLEPSLVILSQIENFKPSPPKCSVPLVLWIKSILSLGEGGGVRVAH